MTVRVSDICEAMERWAPAALACDWDKIGLQIGDPAWPVRDVVTCLTVTPHVLAAAKKAKATMIVAHHPLIWDPLKALRADDAHVRLCLDIAAAKIAFLAAHTNLDAAPGGVNDTLAGLLGLQDTRPWLPVPQECQYKLVTFVPETHLVPLRDALARAGAGVIGEYTHCSFSTPGTGTFLPGPKAAPVAGQKGVVNEESEHRLEILVPGMVRSNVLEVLFRTHPYEEVAYDLIPLDNPNPQIGLGLLGRLPKALPLEAFAARVRDVLGLTHLRVAGAPRKSIRHVALLGGSGGGEVHALPAGIDVLVTGDIKYHDALDAQQRGIALIDATHEGTERPIVPVMARYLRAQFKGLKVTSYREPQLFRSL